MRDGPLSFDGGGWEGGGGGLENFEINCLQQPAAFEKKMFAF